MATKKNVRKKDLEYRKLWPRKPVEHIKTSKKIYDRKRDKKSDES